MKTDPDGWTLADPETAPNARIASSNAGASRSMLIGLHIIETSRKTP
ncbi:hypothetical protein R5R73_17255 [Salinicola sp. LHM]|nr:MULTISPECIES: hypothetical protein [unclassified Salinicola]MEC8917569.1 hypothetical protein [Pseudomonadota bacterium]WQH32745.1 hypothetical protein R5R73_17255 [Salinicola sp. LHM]